MTPFEEKITQVKDREEWRATNLDPFSQLPFKTTPSPLAIGISCSNETPEPITDFDAHPFAALNASLAGNGSVIRIPAGKILEGPIEVIHHAAVTNGAFYPRLVVILEPRAQATLIERFSGSGLYFTDSVTEIRLGDGARLAHYRLQEESPEALHLGNIQVRAGRDAVYDSFVFTQGGRLSRSDLGVTLEAEGAECSLNGLYLGGGSRHLEHHTTIEHLQPRGTSRELYKGIMEERSTAVFDGKIVVRPEAFQTNARQTNKNLILSDEAVVNTKPVLEILNNDVRCNHGATIGRLDENQIFYLRSRGMSLTEARGLLTYAFAGELLREIRHLPLRGELQTLLFKKLAGGLKEAEIL